MKKISKKEKRLKLKLKKQKRGRNKKMIIGIEKKLVQPPSYKRYSSHDLKNERFIRQ
jgi:hypothetical protein